MSSSKIAIIGYGDIIPEGFCLDKSPSSETLFDIKPFLKDKKSFKFLSKQDGLALIAASRAWEKADGNDEIAAQTGIYFCVGILPFEDRPLDILCEKSQSNGKLDFERFSTDAFYSFNPLLTFKCLPNMPLYHISYNLNITGSYFITYPGIKEWFVALERAISDLEEGLVEYAIVGAVADQNNFLVRHHMSRTNPSLKKDLIDSASVIILSTSNNHKPLARIAKKAIHYSASHNFPKKLCNEYLPAFVGPVEPSLYFTQHLKEQIAGTFVYEMEDKDTKLYLEMEIL